MKSVICFIALTYSLCHISIGQEHPFDNIDKIETKSDLIGNMVNSIVYANESPKLTFDEIRKIIQSNNALSQSEKTALILKRKDNARIPRRGYKYTTR